jgi:AraC-like DNA-binding protein
VTEFVGVDIGRAIRIENLAAVTRLSTGRFRHAFRCSTGESPYAYVLRRRLEHAQHLMLMTKNTLSEITLDCGFTDQPHLTRLFRRIVGVTPGGLASAATRRTRQIHTMPTESDRQARRMIVGDRPLPRHRRRCPQSDKSACSRLRFIRRLLRL